MEPHNLTHSFWSINVVNSMIGELELNIILINCFLRNVSLIFFGIDEIFDLVESIAGNIRNGHVRINSLTKKSREGFCLSHLE